MRRTRRSRSLMARSKIGKADCVQLARGHAAHELDQQRAEFDVNGPIVRCLAGGFAHTRCRGVRRTRLLLGTRAVRPDLCRKVARNCKRLIVVRNRFGYVAVDWHVLRSRRRRHRSRGRVHRAMTMLVAQAAAARASVVARRRRGDHVRCYRRRERAAPRRHARLPGPALRSARGRAKHQ